MLILGVIQTLTRWVDVLFHGLVFREYCQTAHCSTLWVFHVQRNSHRGLASGLAWHRFARQALARPTSLAQPRSPGLARPTSLARPELASGWHRFARQALARPTGPARGA